MIRKAAGIPILLFFLVGFLFLCVSPVIADDEPPSVEGPVPPFTVRVASRAWSENRYYRILYPRFGIKGVDKILGDYVKKQVADLARAEPSGGSEEDEEQPDKLDTMFDLFSPSHGYVSVVFSDWHVLGGPHPSWDRYALTFDLKTGRRLAVKDLFPNWEIAIPKLMKLIRDEIAAQGCEPDEMNGFIYDLDGKSENFFLDPGGAAFIFNAYNSALWQYNTIAIDEEILLKIGVNPKFWRP